MSTKKFYFLFLIAIAIFAIIFLSQVNQAKNIITKPKAEPLVAHQATNIPIDPADPIYGNPGAPVTVTMFSELGCKKCGDTYLPVKNFIDANPAKARLIWKDAPLGGILTKGNVLAHQAAYCAGQQKQFWPLVQKIMEGKYKPNETGLRQIAADLNLNAADWWQCVQSEEARDRIASAVATAQALGIRSTPAIFVNNKKINLDEDASLEQILTIAAKP